MPTALFLSCGLSCVDAQTGFEGRAGMTCTDWRCCQYLSGHWLGTFQVVLFAMGLVGVIFVLDARNHIWFGVRKGLGVSSSSLKMAHGASASFFY